MQTVFGDLHPLYSSQRTRSNNTHIGIVWSWSPLTQQRRSFGLKKVKSMSGDTSEDTTEDQWKMENRGLNQLTKPRSHACKVFDDEKMIQV